MVILVLFAFGWQEDNLVSTYLNNWQSISLIGAFAVVVIIALIFEWKWLDERKKNKRNK